MNVVSIEKQQYSCLSTSRESFYHWCKMLAESPLRVNHVQSGVWTYQCEYANPTVLWAGTIEVIGKHSEQDLLSPMDLLCDGPIMKATFGPGPYYENEKIVRK